MSEDKNSSFLSSLISSDHDIYSGVKQNFALCEQSFFKTNEVEIDNLEEFIKNIEKTVTPIIILEDLNKSSLRQTLRAFLFAQVEYVGQIDPRMVVDKLSKLFPSISNNPSMLSIFTDEVNNFKNIKKPQQELRNRKILTQLNSLGGDLKALCSEIHEDYESKKNTWVLQKQGFRFSKTGRVTPEKVEDTKKTEPYHKENQKKILDVIDKFKLSNHHSQLFSTPSVKEIFPLDSDIGEKCAKGRIKEIFSSLTNERLLKSQKEYLQLLQEELHKRDNEINLLNIGKKDLPCILSPQGYMKEHSSLCEKYKIEQKVEEKIKETLKYSPHLVGQLLEDNKNSPWYQNIIAKYTCKYSNDIYQNDDELWNAAELAIAGATIIGAIAAAPAIGLVSAGAGLYTLGALAIGTEGYIAVSRINEANKTETGVLSGQVTNQSSLSFQISEQERAEYNKKWAVFDTAMTIIGAGPITKTSRLAKAIPSPKIKKSKQQVSKINEAKDIRKPLDEKLNQYIILAKDLRKDGVHDIEVSQEKNNLIMRSYGDILREQGVHTELYESNQFWGFYNLRIISTEKGAPSEFKLYQKAAKKFGANQLTISIIDNIDSQSLGFFIPNTKRVELGYEILSQDIPSQAFETPRHELRHLLNLNRRQSGENNLFDGSFTAAKNKTLYDNRPLGQYEDYMSIDELYTIPSDLWQMSKGKNNSKIENMKGISNKLRLLKKISNNAVHLSNDFLKALEKNPKVTVESEGGYSILNEQGHSYIIHISDKKKKELIGFSDNLTNHPSAGLMRNEMKKRLTDLKLFAKIQNTKVKRIIELISNKLDNERIGVQYQTEEEFTLELRAEFRNLGQNTRWLYSKDKP